MRHRLVFVGVGDHGQYRTGDLLAGDGLGVVGVGEYGRCDVEPPSRPASWGPGEIPHDRSAEHGRDDQAGRARPVSPERGAACAGGRFRLGEVGRREEGVLGDQPGGHEAPVAAAHESDPGAVDDSGSDRMQEVKTVHQA